MAAASNTTECLEEFIGRTVVGVLISALPVNRPDLARGTRTLVFGDGCGLTFNSNGAFWAESKEDINRALKERETELRKTQGCLEAVLRLAGSQHG